jgi:peptidoglycan L-alanyl-D-glutamate endopeptidase CwlK
VFLPLKRTFITSIEKLRPKTKELCKLFIQKCKENGIDVTITQTDRSIDLQNAYYAQGRESLSEVNAKRKAVGLSPITEKENKSIVTKAKGGTSPHNFSLAFDFVPIKNGIAQWNDISLFKKCGEIGKYISVDGYSLEWGGDFKSIKDYPHFQLKNWKNYK